ncbi:elongation factor 1-delta-like isoform X2 [Ptychodera flava]|uniref:elongation factor 1-delta-like isoform X2 n=1 Tax=Ptychodera flava TaxID=63121 RepID=UPI003969D178
MAHPLLLESIWFDRHRVEDAERIYQEKLASQHAGLVIEGTGLAVGLAVENNLVGELKSRLCAVEKENKDLKKVTQDLQAAVSKLQEKVSALEKSQTSGGAAPKPAAAAPAKKEEEDEDDDDDDDDDSDIDLFGSDAEEDEAAAKLKEERLKAYQEKKAKKGPGPVAKSNIVLDVKPWDDETDMEDVEAKVRSIEMDGLKWGASRLVPVGYGIKKLQISCVVEDEKVGTDLLEEQITAFDDLVQSMDVVAFNKV